MFVANKSMSKQATRGGARHGAGRPKGSTDPDARRHQANVRLSDAEMAKARMLGNGNASRGMRLALQCHGMNAAAALKILNAED